MAGARRPSAQGGHSICLLHQRAPAASPAGCKATSLCQASHRAHTPAHLVREMGMALGLEGGLQGGGPLLLHVCACPVIGPPHYSGCKVRTGGSIPHPGVKLPYCLLTRGWRPTSTGCMQSPGTPGPCSLAETTGDLWLLAHLNPLPSPQTPRTRAWLGSYPHTL